MTDMIIIYIPCVSKDEAEKIGGAVMKKRLAPCYNIIPEVHSAAFWPPKTGEIERVEGAVLIIKTGEGKYDKIEKTVKSLHSDTNPCIFALPVTRVSKDYHDWLVSEIS